MIKALNGKLTFLGDIFSIHIQNLWSVYVDFYRVKCHRFSILTIKDSFTYILIGHKQVFYLPMCSKIKNVG